MSEIKKKDGGLWGSCAWVLTEDNDLAIGRGTGAMDPGDSVPWKKHKEDIRSVLFIDEADMPEGSSLKNFFEGYTNLREVDLKNLNTKGVISMQSMFSGCKSLLGVDMSGMDTSDVISMSKMFRDCTGLRVVNMSGIDTSNVTGMSQMFSGCTSLEEVDLSGIDTSNVANMLGMFMSCGNLGSIDLSGFDTSAVTDMNMMFTNCSKLRELDISGFNTENVQDMSFMFSFCRELEYLYLGDFNTGKARNMRGMFTHCRKLRSLDLSTFDTACADDVSGMFAGCEGLKCGKLGEKCLLEGRDSEWPFGTEPGTFYCEEDADFTVCYDSNEKEEPSKELYELYSAGMPVTTANNSFAPAEGMIFKEWNTRRDGTGTGYSEGEHVEPVYGDIKLYAIWAGRPILSVVRDIRAITYGQMIDMEWLHIDDNKGTILSKELQISADGENDWRTVGRDEVLPVSCDGSYLRCVVSNYVGETVSEKQKLSILKADYDMSRVIWKKPEYAVYDGVEKEVELENVPDTIKVLYRGNKAADAGTYTASAELGYDEENYNRPADIEDCVWEIRKADLDLSKVCWDYDGPFVYDGKEEAVFVSNLPEGTKPIYVGNRQKDAGRYHATVKLEYDVANYNLPPEIKPLDWEISRGDFDMSEVEWRQADSFVYDGCEKSVFLENIPEGLLVTYVGNRYSDAGEYVAAASFAPKDPINMNVPAGMSKKWTIAKADYDMADTVWSYDGPKVYNGSVQEIEVRNVPDGLLCECFGNIARNVGEYKARAVFKPIDGANYNKPDDLICEWEIYKADYDMGQTAWNYEQPFIYNGEVRRISLKDLPEGVTAEYTGNEAAVCGRYEATASFDYDTENYNEPVMESCLWDIVKAECRMRDVVWDYSKAFVYDGDEKKVELSGMPGNVSVIYSDNRAVDAGEYDAVAEFTVDDPDNYNTPEPMRLRWQIQKGRLDMSGAQWDYNGDLVYDGERQSIVLNGLPDEVTVTYEGNSEIDAGSYCARALFAVEETGNYIAPDPMTEEWEIQKARYDMSGACWEYADDFVYDGEIKTVVIRGLPEGVTPVYTDNSAVRAAKYIASAGFTYDEKNYEEPSINDFRWEIRRATYDISGAAWDYSSPFVYDGAEKRVGITGLRADADVEYEGCAAVDAGDYTAKAFITAKDKGNFTDPEAMTCRWTISKAGFDMSGVRWSYDSPIVYNGRQHANVLTGIPEGLLVRYEGNEAVDAGTYTARAVFRPKDASNYITPEPIECRWEIVKADFEMEDVRWSYTKPLVYSGEVQEVTLTNLPDGLTASYSGNRACDTGSYTAVAELQVADEKNYNLPSVNNLKWEIVKADFDVRGVVWNYTRPLVYNADEQEVRLENLPEGLMAVYEGNKATAVGKYEAEAELRPLDTANYNVPDARSISWEIEKADVDMSEVRWSFEPGEFVYDGKLKSVSLIGLPRGVKAVYRGNSEIRAGEYVAEAALEIEDTENYNVPVVHSCIWKIRKADYDMSAVRWVYDGGFVYDGEEKSVELIDLPAGVSAVYSGHCRTDAGTYCAKAEFVCDRANYNVPEPKVLEWEIGKAPTDVSGIEWNESTHFTYDGEEKSVVLEGLGRNMKALYKNNAAADAGEYRAEAAVVRTDSDNYAQTPVDSCVWSIAKADVDMSGVRWNYDGPFTYDGSCKKIELSGVPDAVEVSYRGNAADAAGEYTAVAEFDVDRRNYNLPDTMTCRWEINRAPVDTGGVVWDYEEAFVFDGKKKTVQLKEKEPTKGLLGWIRSSNEPIEYVGLPAGTSVYYEANTAIEPGDYTARAVIVPSDENNYERETIVECRWSIKKQD